MFVCELSVACKLRISTAILNILVYRYYFQLNDEKTSNYFNLKLNESLKSKNDLNGSSFLA